MWARECENWCHKMIPEEIWEAIGYEVARGELEYDDNHRAYLIDGPDPLFREVYKAQQNRGCCGYLDTSYISKDGRKWAIGYNYGH